MDFDQDVADVPPLTPGADEPWSRYPQSHFGNWTPDQVNRCRMLTICKDEYSSQIHGVDVFKDGTFDKPEEGTRTRQIPSDPAVAREFWDELQRPASSFFSRAMHSSEVLDRLKIFGCEPCSSRTSPTTCCRYWVQGVLPIISVYSILTASRYNIEPFFFASSANWIPSRYQEDPQYGTGDRA